MYNTCNCIQIGREIIRASEIHCNNAGLDLPFIATFVLFFLKPLGNTSHMRMSDDIICSTDYTVLKHPIVKKLV